MKRFLVILILVVGFFLLKTFYQAGQFKSIDPHFDGEVTKIYTNMPGPEDLQIDHETGVMFISSSARREDGDSNKDGIYVLDLTSAENPTLLPNDYTGSFHPHGISILRKDSTLYVFVINHNDTGDYIEKFKFNGSSLKHLASYSSPDMCCPNDLVAIDVDKFYVSNDHGAKTGIMRILEDYIRIPRSALFYYDGNSFTKAAGPFNYANGVNVSNDKSRLYLTTTTGASIITFDVHDDASLSRRGTTDLGTGVDNIDIDEDGNLWIGAHPKLLDFVSHAKDSTSNSPAQVLKLVPVGDYSFSVEEIYLNDGREISGSSVGVYYKNELFIGVVFDHTLLRASLSK